MKPTDNTLTIVKQRCLLPSMKRVYGKNIETWFDKKPKIEHSNIGRQTNVFLNSERPLHSLTQKEFSQLKKNGILWELYPDAPEFYWRREGENH